MGSKDSKLTLICCNNKFYEFFKSLITIIFNYYNFIIKNTDSI